MEEIKGLHDPADLFFLGLHQQSIRRIFILHVDFVLFFPFLAGLWDVVKAV